MKTKIQKLVLITLTMSGLLGQIGCGLIDDSGQNNCTGSYMEPQSRIFETKFNGQIIAPLETLRIDYYFYETFIDMENNVVSKLNISDRTSVYELWNFGDDTTTESTINDFPVIENQTKTFPIEISMKADFWKITNLSNGKVAHLPPVTPFSGFIDWKDDTTFSMHKWNDLGTDDGAYSDLSKLVNLDIVHISDLNTMALEYSTLLEVRSHLGIHNPPLSPMSNLKIDFERTRKNWTGTTNVKVIQNSNYIFHTFTTITLTDGIDILEQTTDDIETIHLGGC